MAKKYTVFISSILHGLEDERDFVYEYVRGIDHIPVGMEYFGSRSKKSVSVIQDFIKECDFQISIIGNRYGELIDGENISYTEMEYDFAEKLEIPQIVFIQRKTDGKYSYDDKNHMDNLDSFRTKVCKNKQILFWETTENFKKKSGAYITKLITEHGNSRPGWVRGDQSDDWLKKRLESSNNELEGLKIALMRYRENIHEYNSKIHLDVKISHRTNLTGQWASQTNAVILELFDNYGLTTSFFKTGTHDHWLWGIWRENKQEIDMHIWRRENIPGIDGNKRLTVMQGKIFNLKANTFEWIIDSTDGKADLNFDYSENQKFKRIKRK